MIGCVSRCVQRLEPELGPVDGVAVGEHDIELEGDLVGLRERGKACDLRTGSLADLRRCGPVIGVRVSEQDPTDALDHRCADDRIDMTREVGPRIDHRHLIDADEIGVRARTRHQVGRTGAAVHPRAPAGNGGLRGSGGRYWVRTSDLFRVREARYHCANRPSPALRPVPPPRSFLARGDEVETGFEPV